MARTPSQMIDLGSTAPAFDLPIANPWVDDTNRETRSLSDYADAQVAVVIFTCNHCPYAVHVEDELVAIANEYAKRGVQFIAISSNDADQYPADSFDEMATRARDKQFPFPYLYDESQEIAQAYNAACTPDIFVYDSHRALVYRGRVDETRPRTDDVAHGGELRAALDVILETGQGPAEQYPSIGCNIKWKAGNAPIVSF